MRSTIKSIMVASVLTFAGVAQVSAGITLRYAEGGPDRGTRAAAVQFFADKSLVYLSNFSTTGVQFERTEGNRIRPALD
jgi:hypothetical protein